MLSLFSTSSFDKILDFTKQFLHPFPVNNRLGRLLYCFPQDLHSTLIVCLAVTYSPRMVNLSNIFDGDFSSDLISPEISQNVFGCILSKRKNWKYIENEISNKLKGERKRFIQANQIGTELRSICETAHSVCHHMATLEGYNMLEKSNDLIDEINTKANSKIWLLNEKIRNIPIIS